MNENGQTERTDAFRFAEHYARTAGEFGTEEKENVKRAYASGYLQGEKDTARKCRARADDAADTLLTEISAWECELSGLRSDVRKFKENIKKWETS